MQISGAESRKKLVMRINIFLRVLTLPSLYILVIWFGCRGGNHSFILWNWVTLWQYQVRRAPERPVTMANSQVILWLPTWPELVMSRPSCWGRHHPGNQKLRDLPCFLACHNFSSLLDQDRISSSFHIPVWHFLALGPPGAGLPLPLPIPEGPWPLWQQIHCTT